jgi:ABC-2 type transport system permease protein
MRVLPLLWHQFRFDQKRFWRDPAGIFYAVVFPMIFLALFVAVLGNNEEAGRVAGRTLESANYYLPAVLTLSVVSVTFVNLAVSLTAARERGTLKRARGTPLPTWVFMAGRIATSIAITILIVVLVVGAGRAVYGVPLPASALLGALLTLAVGAAAFCCLAFALTVVMPSANAAAAIALTASLVLYFMSGLFARNDVIPEAVQRVADVFPVKHLFESLAIGFDPNTSGPGIQGWHLAVLASWGLAAFLVSVRFFRWTPSSG